MSAPHAVSDLKALPMPAGRDPMPARRDHARRVACFSVQAECEPGVMPRVLQLFAKRNLVPSRWHSDVLESSDGRRELSIDIQVEGLTPETRDYVARCLRQLHYVDAVLTSEKRLV